MENLLKMIRSTDFNHVFACHFQFANILLLNSMEFSLFLPLISIFSMIAEDFALSVEEMEQAWEYLYWANSWLSTKLGP